ncbi:MAG: hypothetical protein LBV46_03440 [Bacteroidales bacterium]|nr:hypothetical protein [Bacteroidales bacterium]
MATIASEDEYKAIFATFTNLQGFGKKVFLLGYTDAKEVPFYCLKQLSTEYFCKKEINFYGKPDTPRLNDFLLNEYDILIDYTQGHCLPLAAMLVLSHARFTVGANKYHKDFYDLFLDMENQPTQEELTNAIENYTNKLTGKDEIR